MDSPPWVAPLSFWQSGRQAYDLTRGFASQPYSWFAFIEESFRFLATRVVPFSAISAAFTCGRANPLIYVDLVRYCPIQIPSRRCPWRSPNPKKYKKVIELTLCGRVSQFFRASA